MSPAFETSVIHFPNIEQRSRPSKDTSSDVAASVTRTAEEIRLNWMKRNVGPSHVPERMRLIWAAVGSDLSDKALRVLLLQQSFGNGGGKDVFPSDETIATLARCNEKTVRRANKELEDKGWISTTKKRREVATRTARIPEALLKQIGAEIMENIGRRSSIQDRTKMSTQDNFTLVKPNQDWTKMSTQEPLLDDQDRTKMSTQGPDFPPREADFGVKTGHFCPLRLDKNVHLTLKEDLNPKKNKQGAESDCIQSGRDLEQAQPPIDEKSTRQVEKAAAAILAGLAGAAPAAAAPAEPPAIVRPLAPVMECWQTPKARQAAFLSAAEAQAQREVGTTPDGRLIALGGFLSELQGTFPLVDTTCGLMAAAANLRPYMTAIETMATIRRQFAYMQQDEARKEKRAKEFAKQKSGGIDRSDCFEAAPGVWIPRKK